MVYSGPSRGSLQPWLTVSWWLYLLRSGFICKWLLPGASWPLTHFFPSPALPVSLPQECVHTCTPTVSPTHKSNSKYTAVIFHTFIVHHHDIFYATQTGVVNANTKLWLHNGVGTKLSYIKRRKNQKSKIIVHHLCRDLLVSQKVNMRHGKIWSIWTASCNCAVPADCTVPWPRRLSEWGV
jgi:hypothetical protein